MIAASNDYPICVKSLLREATFKNMIGETALMMAIDNLNNECAMLLMPFESG